jgi:hypothetical protein
LPEYFTTMRERAAAGQKTTRHDDEITTVAVPLKFHIASPERGKARREGGKDKGVRIADARTHFRAVKKYIIWTFMNTKFYPQMVV